MATNERPPPKVIIVGAGLAGLSLAQALKHQNIPCVNYERDLGEVSRFQGWAISLHPWVVKIFNESFNPGLPDLDTLSVTRSTGEKFRGALVDAETYETHFEFKDVANARSIRVGRAKLRHWLTTDVDIRYGKHYTHYVERPDGIEIFFTDGTSEKGDILVGADGINSHVRSQLCGPDYKPLDLPMGIIMGELTISKDLYPTWMKVIPHMLVAGKPGRRYFVGLKGVADDLETASFYWMCGWKDEAATKPGFWTHRATQEELLNYVKDNLLDGVHSNITQVIHATPSTGIIHPTLHMKDMTPPTNLPKGRITLVGDAAHPMVPFRGQGGCQAMKDGTVLAKMLAADHWEHVPEIIDEYHKEMVERTTEAVLASRDAAFATGPQSHVKLAATTGHDGDVEHH